MLLTGVTRAAVPSPTPWERCRPGQRACSLQECEGARQAERRFPKERVDHYRVSTKTATLTDTVIRHWPERRYQTGEEPEMGDVLSDSSVGFARDNGIYRALRLF